MTRRLRGSRVSRRARHEINVRETIRKGYDTGSRIYRYVAQARRIRYKYAMRATKRSSRSSCRLYQNFIRHTWKICDRFKEKRKEKC